MNQSEISIAVTGIYSLKESKMCEVPYLSNGNNNLSSESNLFTCHISQFFVKNADNFGE